MYSSGTRSPDNDENESIEDFSLAKRIAYTLPQVAVTLFDMTLRMSLRWRSACLRMTWRTDRRRAVSVTA